MKVTEIRLENLLTLNDKVRQELFNNEIHARNKYFKVLSIYSNGDILLELDDENVEIDIKDIEPIPLTEEWLLRLGFIKKKNTPSIELYVKDDFIIRFDPQDKFQFYINGKYINIDHLHHLQNLYFALTNEELTFKP